MPVVLVEAGDLLSKPVDKTVNAKCLKAIKEMKYDALNIGEQDILDDNALTSGVPYISANLRRSGPAEELTPYITKKLDNNISVAIIGVTDKESFEGLPPNKAGLWIVDDPMEKLKELVPKLNKEGNFVVVLAHGSIGFEDKIATAVKGIKLIVASHSPRSYDKGGGRRLEGSILVNTSLEGKHLGQIEFTVDTDNSVNAYKDELISIEPNIAEDPIIKEIVK